MYAYVLNEDGSVVQIADLDPKLGGAMALDYDTYENVLWVAADDGFGNMSAKLTLTGEAEPELVHVAPAAGVDVTRNNEGFAIAEARYTVDGQRPVYRFGDGFEVGALTIGSVDCDYKEEAPAATNPFTDVKEDAWYYDSIMGVYREGMMEGYGDGIFAPENNLTRAEFAQIIYNLEDRPGSDASNPFEDVDSEDWFFDAVRWAVGEGIVEGYGNGNFGPDDLITREQLTTMLWRYAKTIGLDLTAYGADSLKSFSDASKISQYALASVQWACGEKILIGMGNGTLAPAGNATRAQAATMLMRFTAIK